jgi:protein FAM50
VNSCTPHTLTAQTRTVGLVTADEFRKAREDAEKAPTDKDGTAAAAEIERAAAAKREDKKRRQKKKKALATLSFGGDMDDEIDDDADATAADGRDSKEQGDSNSSAAAASSSSSSSAAAAAEAAKKKISKNPNVDTTFLPDREREALVAQEKALLRQEWLAEQMKIKQEILEVRARMK